MENEKMKELVIMCDLFKKCAPEGAVLLDFIRRKDEYIVLYQDDGNPCTPYIIHHLTDSGLCCGRYYDNGYLARMDFDEMR